MELTKVIKMFQNGECILCIIGNFLMLNGHKVVKAYVFGDF